MNRLIIAAVAIGVGVAGASAQVPSSVASSPPKDLLSRSEVNISRARTVSGNEQSASRSTPSSIRPAKINGNGSETTGESTRNPTRLATAGAASARVPAPVLTQEYRVGVGDVLDVQLPELPTKRSTLFTVREGGSLDYPLAGDPLAVGGLTVEEIAIRLRARIKVLENPWVVVKVRDYASHNVIITGLVADPGAKFLRREAIPLYVILLEAQPRPEATSVTLTRVGQAPKSISLDDQQAMSILIVSGDLIKVIGQPKETTGFFYAGGALNSPGQKVFHNGLTLTQAILLSGGLTHDAGNKAKIARQAADGRLSTTEHNLRQIQDGKTADPVLQRGDRIMIAENR